MAEGLLVLILNIMHRSTYKRPSAIVRSYRQLTLSSPSQLHSAQLPFSPIILRRRLTVASRSSFSSSHSSHATLPPSVPPLFPPSHGRPLPFLSVRTTEYAPLVFGYSHATRADTLPPHSNPCSLSYEIVMCFPSQLRYDISHLVYDLSSP